MKTPHIISCCSDLLSQAQGSPQPLTGSRWLQRGSKHFWLLWLILCTGSALFQYLCASSTWIYNWAINFVHAFASRAGLPLSYDAPDSLTFVIFGSIALSCYMILVFLREERAASRMHLCILMFICLLLAPFVGLIWGIFLPLVAPAAALLYLYILHLFLPTSSVD